MTLVVVVALDGAARARQPSTGIVDGTVIDGGSGQPLARVLIRDEESGVSVSSDARGRFELTLPVGAAGCALLPSVSSWCVATSASPRAAGSSSPYR